MATLHLICGLPGAGKTTLARRLEAELPAVRLTPDEWLMRLKFEADDVVARASVEAIQWEMALALLKAGSDVIVENGFWRRAERLALRAEVAAIGASSRLHFLDVPLEELERRVAARNAAPSGLAFHIDPGLIAAWFDDFERPEPEELEG